MRKLENQKRVPSDLAIRNFASDRKPVFETPANSARDKNLAKRSFQRYEKVRLSDDSTNTQASRLPAVLGRTSRNKGHVEAVDQRIDPAVGIMPSRQTQQSKPDSLESSTARMVCDEAKPQF